MEFKVEEVKKIDEGKQFGKIIAVEYREQPFKYTDTVIELSNGLKLKAGYPTSITAESKLGMLLREFGADVKVGASINPEEVLVGQGCSFIVMNEKTERGTFAKIVAGSLKPVDQAEEETVK